MASDAVKAAEPAPAMIQRSCGCAACARNEEQSSIQTKLSLGRQGDRYEQEADWIAAQVTAERPMPLTGPLPVTPLIQRQAEEEEEEEELLQPKSAGSEGHTSAALSQAAGAVASGGRPFAASERAYFEPRFGRDLSAVRIHEGAGAAAAAGGISARAYTLGNHIAFAQGEFTPQTHSGRHLIAHELTHTFQQAGRGALGRIRRVPQTPTRAPEAPTGGSARPAAALSPRTRLMQALMEMCRRSDTASILDRIDNDNVEIRFFKTASDKWRLADGTEEEEDLSTRLRGNTFIDPSTGHGIIRINGRLTDRQMVETLFHEAQHWIHRQTAGGPKGLESEIQARISTEQMAIDRGWPETVPGYRTPDGRVDEAFIRQQMQTSPHYSPTGRTRVRGSRLYGGETTIPGPFACPPVGDFPTPRSDIAYA